MLPYEDNADKKAQVERMFDSIAHRYDTLNRVLSFGVDTRWRKKTVRSVVEAGPENILDLATGTGDMAIALARKMPGARVTGADLSAKMLEGAAVKIGQAGLSEKITLKKAEAESLPFGDSQFDAATVAFGVRNFHDIPQGLREMNRVLKPGGTIHILEFSIPRNRLFGALYRFYFHKVLPFAGGMISKDHKAYRYLPGSVDEFPPPERFTAMMEEAGFGQCRARNMTNGVAVLYTGIKDKP